ncbi:hypothetical protein E4T66_18365 [Sinimarinibacterium sp. CAU 1509]|uniref:hypothetical protein n=1 Tax=Sinimarinibacterium sp. CAU 1509 TaxID=2562283 RepID=UPI0010AC5E45|nr:hypothetical protein [Sinimarinibacterium sp. CAU 1509]TJY57371.1 hypothetical protein E4T66_18365 [Sinimarinibacterium sp. CAU 1509]
MSDPAVDNLVPTLEAWAPFLQDGARAQDIAMTYALPYHSLMMDALWSTWGLSALAIGLIFVLFKLMIAPGWEAWKIISAVVVVYIFSFPVPMDYAEKVVFHSSRLPVSESIAPPSESVLPPFAVKKEKVALGVAVFLYAVNGIEDLLYSVVSFSTEEGEPSPMATFQAMSMSYIDMYDEPSLRQPIDDYYKNCAYLRNEPAYKSIDQKEWLIYGLGGVPTFGYDATMAEAQLVDSTLANSMLGKWIPGIEAIVNAKNSAAGYMSGRDGSQVKAILAASNPTRIPDMPLNQEPYHILSADYWRERAKTNGAESANKLYLSREDADALSEFDHPRGETPDTDLYATNCLELFQIADTAVREMRKGSSSAYLKDLTGALTPRALAVYGASTFGTMRAGAAYAANLQKGNNVYAKSDPNRTRAVSPEDTDGFGTQFKNWLGRIVGGASGAVSETGIWAQSVIKLPDVIMMTVGGTSLLSAILVIFTPILLLAGFATGSLSVISVPLRAILMLKLALVLMFLILKMGTGLLETLSIYWTYSQIVDQVNTYPMLPLMHAAHTGTLILVMAAPPVLGYMLAFGSTTGFSRFSGGRAGAANLAAGAGALYTGAKIAGAVVPGPGQVGAMSSALSGGVKTAAVTSKLGFTPMTSGGPSGSLSGFAERSLRPGGGDGGGRPVLGMQSARQGQGSNSVHQGSVVGTLADAGDRVTSKGAPKASAPGGGPSAGASASPATARSGAPRDSSSRVSSPVSGAQSAPASSASVSVPSSPGTAPVGTAPTYTPAQGPSIPPGSGVLAPVSQRPASAPHRQSSSPGTRSSTNRRPSPNPSSARPSQSTRPSSPQASQSPSRPVDPPRQSAPAPAAPPRGLDRPPAPERPAPKPVGARAIPDGPVKKDPKGLDKP